LSPRAVRSYNAPINAALSTVAGSSLSVRTHHRRGADLVCRVTWQFVRTTFVNVRVSCEQTVAENLYTTGCAFQPLTPPQRLRSPGSTQYRQQPQPPTTTPAAPPTVLFAGEAACPAFPAYTHGAYLSGVLAAHDLLTQLQLPGYNNHHHSDNNDNKNKKDDTFTRLLRTAELCRPSPCASSSSSSE
jgi:hypothetical protein